MNTNNTNANNGNNKATNNANVEAQLKAAMKSVREAIMAKQLQIDNETDPVKKGELAEELKKMTAEIGLVFDGDQAAAEAQAKTYKEAADEQGMQGPTKPGMFARAKGWVKAKVEVIKHNKVKTAAVVAGVAAVVAATVYAKRNPQTVNAGIDTVRDTVNDSVDAANVAVDGFVGEIGGFFTRIIGSLVYGVVYAKNWIFSLFTRNAVVETTTTTIEPTAAAFA